jgi:glycosyltransferase involved in cell wall biosynthesis
MFDTPITIILPVKHYVPKYLKAATQSVLDQSSGDWRLILVADRSVVPELESFLQGALSDSRFQLIAGMPNLAARINVGMKQATASEIPHINRELSACWVSEEYSGSTVSVSGEAG